MRTILTLFCAACVAVSCSKDQSAAEATMDFVVRFDAAQPRLDNIGQAAPIPAGNAAQTPQFREMSIHYIELAPNALTPLGQGAVVYHAEEVNPLFATSPIPPGSCAATGKLAKPLVIAGDEKKDVTVTLSFSINQSFEWVDANGNGQLDFYGDGVTSNERIVDMGLRGLVPSWK